MVPMSWYLEVWICLPSDEWAAFLKGDRLMSREFVDFAIDERIALVTVDRPPVNALNKQVQEEIRDVFEELRLRNDAGAVIVTGGGKKAFVAGADIQMISDLAQEEAFDMSQYFQGVLTDIEEFDKVVIAAINGLALGGGCEVALACDIRVADEGAAFGFPEVGLGVLPGAGGTQRLPRLVGNGKAKELILTGDSITAEEAISIGLVERVAPRGEAISEAKRIAKRILVRGPIAVAKAKKAINEGGSLSLKGGLELEARLFSELFETRDKREGVAAFLEKRKPEFVGK